MDTSASERARCPSEVLTDSAGLHSSHIMCCSCYFRAERKINTEVGASFGPRIALNASSKRIRPHRKSQERKPQALSDLLYNVYQSIYELRGISTRLTRVETQLSINRSPVTIFTSLSHLFDSLLKEGRCKCDKL